MPQVYAYKESSEVAAAVGQHVLKLQDEALAASNVFTIALSGGLLGNVLKKALIDDERVAPLIKWTQWQVYFSDERIVPLLHEDSNFGLFNAKVLQNLPGGARPTVHTIDESLVTGHDGQTDSFEEDKDVAIAQRYAALLPPRFDLILLGCGPDGHTCLLFPHHPLLQKRDAPIGYIKDLPKPPPRRITFTLPVLEAAQAIAFVAEGAGKAAILKQIFGPEAATLPSGLVNQLGAVAWFVDDSAINGVDVIASKY